MNGMAVSDEGKGEGRSPPRGEGRSPPRGEDHNNHLLHRGSSPTKQGRATSPSKEVIFMIFSRDLFKENFSGGGRIYWNGAIHNPRHVKPQTRQTPDTSNIRHIKPQTKNIGLSTTPQINAFFIIWLCSLCFLILFVSNCFKKWTVLVGHITLSL